MPEQVPRSFTTGSRLLAPDAARRIAAEARLINAVFGPETTTTDTYLAGLAELTESMVARAQRGTLVPKSE